LSPPILPLVEAAVIVMAILLITLALSGCNVERSQAAADARAGIQAAAPHADDKGKQILAGVDARLPAAAGVPSGKWPAPIMGPEDIEKDPPKYVSTAPPEPKGLWMETAAIAGTVGTIALFILGKVAPSIPGIGPAVGGIANLGWSLLANRHQKAADNAKDIVATGSDLILLALKEYSGPMDQRVYDAVEALARTKV